MEKDLISTEELKPPKSRLAVVALALLCIPFIFFAIGMLFDILEIPTDQPIISLINIVIGIASLFSLIASTWVAVAALILIAKSKIPLRGKDLATTVVVVSTPIILIICIMPYIGSVKSIAQRVICGTNLKGMATALTVYANDHQHKLPDHLWCDIIIAECDVHPKSFVCPASDMIEGECSYGLNKYISSLDNVPPDLVLLFETKNGHQSGRMGLIETREGFSKFPILKKLFSDKEEAIDCWNQRGGPELLSTANHNYQGCNIAFADGHTEWVTYNYIPSLKWSMEDPNLRWIPETIPPVESGNNCLYWLSGIILISTLLFGLIYLKKALLLFYLLSGALSSATGLIGASQLEYIAYLNPSLSHIGYKAGMIWGAIAGVAYAFWLVKNLSRRDEIWCYRPYAGILLGIICGLLTNITLIVYHNEFEFASFGLACYSGLPAGAVMGMLLGNIFDRMVKSLKPNE
jgi:prepilin-type processing-associated H-X9-DG protein